MDWTRKEVLKLIDLYRKFECLWNYNHKDYKNILQKSEAWVHIAKVCGKDQEHVKQKIISLRQAYVATKRKADASKKSGITYKPLLYYFERFKFLDPVICFRRTDDNSCDNSLKEDSDASNEIFVPFSSNIIEEETQDPLVGLTEETSNSSPPHTTQSPTHSTSPTPCTKPLISRKRKICESNGNEKIEAAIETIVKSVTTPEPENIYTRFGKTIAFQLQQLPDWDAIETMNDIHTMVTRKLMRSMASKKRQDNGD